MNGVTPVFDHVWTATPDAAAVAALTAAATAADGVAPIGENTLLHLDDGDSLLVTAADGTLVAFAHLGAPDADGSRGAELVVHPGRRRQGIGTRLVEELVAWTGATLRVWAHGDHAGAAAIAERLGFTRVRELWKMRLRLADAQLPEPVFPNGVTVRSFRVGVDEPEFLRVNNAAFDWHPEQGGWGIEQVRLREAEPWFDAEGFLLAVDAEDRLLGYHWTKVHADEQPPVGEVYVLGVDPGAQGMRLGSALTLAGLRYLRARGLDTVILYVESDNAAAIRVYEALGFSRWDVDVAYQHDPAGSGG